MANRYPVLEKVTVERRKKSVKVVSFGAHPLGRDDSKVVPNRFRCLTFYQKRDFLVETSVAEENASPRYRFVDVATGIEGEWRPSPTGALDAICLQIPSVAHRKGYNGSLVAGIKTEPMQARIRSVFGLDSAQQPPIQYRLADEVSYTPQRKRRQSKSTALDIIKRQRVVSVDNDEEEVEPKHLEEDQVQEHGNFELEHLCLDHDMMKHVDESDVSSLDNVDLSAAGNRLSDDDWDWIDGFTSSVETPSYEPTPLPEEDEEAYEPTPLPEEDEEALVLHREESKGAELQLKYQEKESKEELVNHTQHDIVEEYFTDLLNYYHDEDLLLDAE